VIFTVLPEALRAFTSWQWQMLLYGILLVAVLFLMPRGIVPTLFARSEGA
jgi:branched-chain amino acid transport system permease protein